MYSETARPEGAYAAVIPHWIDALINGETPVINGDGETSRDFCYISNVVQANILAAMCDDPEALDRVYNIAYGERTTLNELFVLIKRRRLSVIAEVEDIEPSMVPCAKETFVTLWRISPGRGIAWVCSPPQCPAGHGGDH